MVFKFFIFSLIFTFTFSWAAAIASNVLIKDDHEHVLPHGHWFIDKIFLQFSNETLNYTLLTKESLEEIMISLNLETDPHHDHDHDHDHYAIDLDKLRHDILNDNNTYENCYSLNELLEIFDLANEELITKDQFQELGPSLIWMTINEECQRHEHSVIDQLDQNETWLFGSLAIVLTWLFSQTAVFILGKVRKGKVLLILILQAFAAGNLLGDALLHLLPSSLGLHSHSHDNDHHDHGDEEDPMMIQWKMCAILGTIFIFWAIECVLHNHHNHCHSLEDVQDINGSKSNDAYNLEGGFKNDASSTDLDVKASPERLVEVKSNVSLNSIKDSLKKIRPNGWIAFFGDCLHKAADGLATGAAFSESLSLGVSTALAIFFHEIPHELGDFAVLQSAGFKLYTILILNSIASLCSLIAFFIVSFVSTDDVVREWIFTVVIGVFFYISLINLLPKLRSYFEEKEHHRSKKVILFVLGSFFIGLLIMFLLAFFEEDIMITI